MIRTRSLRYAYAGGPDLSFRDVSVPQGGTLLLRGNSGTGKSTWLSLAAGLLTPTAGEMVVAGQRLGDLSGAARDRHLVATGACLDTHSRKRSGRVGQSGLVP